MAVVRRLNIEIQELTKIENYKLELAIEYFRILINKAKVNKDKEVTKIFQKILGVILPALKELRNTPLDECGKFKRELKQFKKERRK